MTTLAPSPAFARYAESRNLLVLIELKGGNDGLNTVVPFAEESYYALRPRLAVSRDQVLKLDARSGLHPSLAPLMALWEARELAVVQGVGHPGANLSHFRSIGIWDTAAAGGTHAEGWLARAFACAPARKSFDADGTGAGPFAGSTCAVASNADCVFRTEFPPTGFGSMIRTASRAITTDPDIAAVRLSLNGFDTHGGQSAVHARLLGDLAEGIMALKSVLVELGRWDAALVVTYSEFGRHPRENQGGGTDHGTASAHFVLGGRVRGGLYGAPPALARLDGNGNLPFAVDFRSLYATVLEQWWGMDAAGVLGGRFALLDLLKA
ncbi:MAG: DUF1501 domain-containing protein [Burkholderiales bacterium]|nr:DUF1501 domain-containing protein [Burkholderiales bacterium]